MAKLQAPKRIIKEDFPQEYQGLIDRLAFSINSFYDEVYNAFNKGIDNNNLTRENVTITVENSSGNLKMPVQFKTSLKSRIVGMNIISVENLTNSNIYPDYQPFVAKTINGNIVTILKVNGIQDNYKYRLTLELIS